MEIRVFENPKIAHECFEKIFIPYFISESRSVHFKRDCDSYRTVLSADIRIEESPREYKKDIKIEITCRSCSLTASFYLRESEHITTISYREIGLIKNIEKYFETLKEMAKKFEEEYNESTVEFEKG